MYESGARVAALSTSDLETLARHGIAADEAERQLALLAAGPRYRSIARPCAVGDGIHRLDEDAVRSALECWETTRDERRIGKLVPASGAASRMFKALHTWRGRLSVDKGAALERLAAEGDGAARAVLQFLSHVDGFPFRDALAETLRARGLELSRLIAERDVDPLVEALLDADGLALGQLPKALVPFHREGGVVRTALGEHLAEAAALGPDSQGRCSLVLTVLPEHEALVREALEREIREVEERYEVQLDVQLSPQEPRTMTLALAEDGEPFRRDDGSLLLRPGGHGALIANLDDLPWDCALVGNVDNVAPASDRPEVVRWKKVLAGHLLRLQARCYDAIRFLRQHSAPTEHDLLDIEGFATRELNAVPPSGGSHSAAERRAALLDTLDRPLRVCGVVRNQGEPGGGPFWVRDEDERVRPQIVEGSEIDRSDPEQTSAFVAATHFNPVNMACGLRDWSGRAFELRRYIDEDAVFLSQRSEEGRELTALERPGLWNGAMAGWNTVFVEVPLSTFRPVKVVNDLLRAEHAPARSD